MVPTNRCRRGCSIPYVPLIFCRSRGCSHPRYATLSLSLTGPALDECRPNQCGHLAAVSVPAGPPDTYTHI